MQPLHVLVELLTNGVRLALQDGRHTLERHAIVATLDLGSRFQFGEGRRVEIGFLRDARRGGGQRTPFSPSRTPRRMRGAGRTFSKSDRPSKTPLACSSSRCNKALVAFINSVANSLGT